MSEQVPVWRIIHGQGPGEWTVVSNGHLNTTPPASPQAKNDAFRMWSASVESLIREEFSGSELPQFPPPTDGTFGRRKCISSAKENLQPKLVGSGSQLQSDSVGVLKGLSPQKRGILTVNFELCNGSTAAPKRRRHFEVPSSKQNDVWPLFQTASMKPIKISSSAMQKAQTLLGFDDTGLSKNDERELCAPSNGLTNAAITSRGLSGGLARQHLDDTAVGSVRPHSAGAPACLFQTATGKAVSISNAGVNRAMALFGDKESSNSDISQNQVRKGGMGNATLEYGFSRCRSPDQTSSLSMFQTARGQSVSVSSSAVKQATKLLGQENFSFPVEAPPSSPPIRFMTGKGQSVSVSSSAMKRARDLLAGELENSVISAPVHMVAGGEHASQRLFETVGGHLIKVSNGSIQRAKVLLGDRSSNTSLGMCRSASQNLDMDCFRGLSAQELPPIKDLKEMHTCAMQESSLPTLNKKGSMPRKLVASFKAPRRLQPALPPVTTFKSMEGPIQSPKHDFSQLVKMFPLHQKGKQRSSLENFFKQQPHQDQDVGLLAREVQTMTAETAKNYKFNTSVHGLESIGSDEFRQMLLEAGANSQLATKEWVGNHFRWIVWKLASLERSYPTKVANKLLTIQTVFDELRYRYEREVNCAHRSALKKITEGDALARRTMVLCVAAVSIGDHTHQSNLLERCLTQQSETVMKCRDPLAVQIEVTDGWYSLNGELDPPLARQLLAGKIFVGQKLRVCGAALIGCTAPMPPLEAFQAVKLALHVNGTYRAHWADKLGFCKGMPMPIAFHCIKHDGGLVPRTIIGVNRIYPVLYYERLPDCRSITRSAKAEELAMRGYHDRRSQIAEETVMRMEKEDTKLLPEKDMEEGAKLFRILENSAEPELLMADMTAAQHAAFTAYQAEREAARQALVEKNIRKALGDVHLNVREVTPFMKVSVMGLSFPGDGEGTVDSIASGCQQHSRSMKGGIVTVWQIPEEQVESLKEGAVYCVSDLYPVFGKTSHQGRNRGALQLRATKSTKWQLLPQAIFSSFSPRRALGISSLGTIPFSSEFDVAVLVVHVGKPYACGLQQRQWLFASDGSMEEEFSKDCEEITSLLAIDLSTSSDAFLPVERSLEGCIIGFCNLVKRCRDERNCLWVAEASGSSVYSSNLSSGSFSHLKAAADKANKWAKASEGVNGSLVCVALVFVFCMLMDSRNWVLWWRVQVVAELRERIQMALGGGS